MPHYVFKLPDIGEGTAEATIAQWRVAIGDRIEEDQPLVDLETDKAIVEVPAPVSGKVLSLHGNAGDKVAVGSELVVIETESRAESVTSKQPAMSSVPASGSPTVIEAPVRAEARPKENVEARPSSVTVLASPAVRKRARDIGIDLQTVSGSGPGGRVTHADLDAALSRDGCEAVQLLRDQATPVQDVVEEHRVVGIRRRIAERMQEAKRRIPHFSYVEEIDMTALEDLREQLNEKYASRRPRLTPLPFVMCAVSKALARHPEINARFDDEKGIVQRHWAVHLGIATQTPHGLMVPVVLNAQRLDLWGCAAEVDRLAAAAREGRATRTELSGSTITITSLGVLGGIASTPIINYPEVAIVGINKIAERPVVRGGAVVVRKMMNLSSSFDHRVTDGWNAALFIQELKRALEEPVTLLV
jgi:2-oxoisovalerate dehydrogenase E2 component (dihydrolipoyl transacylase)